jgi:tripartite-type tricarboxylate transporter receptor subunit TctC
MKRFVSLLAIAAALLAAAQPAAAQSYPTRAIRILVPIPPGGAPDISARVIGQKLSEQLGQPVIVENRPAANGNVAMDQVAKAEPDGYTLGVFADSNITVNPHIYKSMPLDTMKDLAPVASLVLNQWVLSVNPSLPVKDFKEFIDYAKKANPPLLYASGGNGSQHQLAMEMLKQRAGIDLVHVPFKGGSPATTATVAGETAAMFSGTSSAGQIRAGKLRALAVTGPKRSSVFPELPTIGEFYPGYEVVIWLGLFAASGTPKAVIARLHEEVNKALADRGVDGRLAKAGGMQPNPVTPEQFAEMIRRDYDKYGKLVKDIGVKVE